MTTTNKRRVGVFAALLGVSVLLVGATALADGKDGKGGEGCGKRGEARFHEADTNGDGFLTAAEVGEKKWERIKVADANADAKVSLAELKQAKADGKLKGKKGKKKRDEGKEA